MIAINLNHCLSMARTMRNGILRFAAQALVSASLAAQPAAGTPPLHMEPEREIALALSACPPAVGSAAAERFWPDCSILPPPKLIPEDALGAAALQGDHPAASAGTLER
jgi:hypothetical protein